MNARPSVLMPPQCPSDPVPGEGFQDRFLLLVAALSREQDMLTYAGYQRAQGAVHAVFGERALHAEMQAKLLYALLHPPTRPVDLARAMAEQARTHMVSATFVQAMASALADLGSEPGRAGARSGLGRDILWAFCPPSEQGGTTDAVPGWERWPGLDVAHSLAGLYRLGRRWLPQSSHSSDELATDAAAFQAGATAYAETLARIARSTGDAPLQEAVQAFEHLVAEQPYRLVVVGERKRGKSSLVNALVGRALSPVRESTPETATVVEFRHAVAPDYTVRFLDEAQFAHLEAYLADEQGNTLLSAKVAAIRQGVETGVFVPGRLLAGVTCWDDLPDYIAEDGRYAGFVAKVAVALPLAGLRDGVVVVDTPGLNDTDQFHDYLAYEESLSADGVLFVMDARNPGAGSELALLRRLARSGRTVGVIGVLTHTDTLEGEVSLNAAREQAWAVLREACRDAPGVRIYGVAPLDARAAMQARCAAGTMAPGADFAYVLQLVQDMMSRDVNRRDHQVKRSATFGRLVCDARAGVLRYREAQHAALPDAHVLAMLDMHGAQLAEAARQALEQARQVVAAAGHELDNWDREVDRNLATFRDTLVLRLVEAVHQEMDAASFGFAQPALWKRFENRQARQIARECVDEFLEAQREALQGWEAKLRCFTEELHAVSTQCLERARTETADLAGMDAGCDKLTHLLVQTHRHMQALAVFAGGAAAGAATAMTPMLFLLTAGNILTVAASSPAVMAAVAVAAGAVGLVRRLGNPEKRRADFLRKKREEAAQYADRICEALRRELGAVRHDVGRAYDFEVRRGFMPALEGLFYQSVHMRLFLEVMAAIRADADQYAELAQAQLHALEQVTHHVE